MIFTNEMINTAIKLATPTICNILDAEGTTWEPGPLCVIAIRGAGCE